jgi:hypothetical protein
MKNFDIDYLPAESVVAVVGAAAGPGCGFTGAPSWSLSRLSVMTFAPEDTPLSTSQFVPI